MLLLSSTWRSQSENRVDWDKWREREGRPHAAVARGQAREHDELVLFQDNDDDVLVREKWHSVLDRVSHDDNFQVDGSVLRHCHLLRQEQLAVRRRRTHEHLVSQGV